MAVGAVHLITARDLEDRRGTCRAWLCVICQKLYSSNNIWIALVLVVAFAHFRHVTVFARVRGARSTFQRSGKEASTFLYRASACEGTLLFLLTGTLSSKFADLFFVEVDEFSVHVILVLNIDDLIIDLDLFLIGFIVIHYTVILLYYYSTSIGILNNSNLS